MGVREDPDLTFLIISQQVVVTPGGIIAKVKNGNGVGTCVRARSLDTVLQN